MGVGGAGGDGAHRSGRREGLRCSLAPGHSSAGPASRPRSRCPRLLFPEQVPLTQGRHSSLPTRAAPFLPGPTPTRGEGEEVGPQSSPEGDGLRAGTWD